MLENLSLSRRKLFICTTVAAVTAVGCIPKDADTLLIESLTAEGRKWSGRSNKMPEAGQIGTRIDAVRKNKDLIFRRDVEELSAIAPSLKVLNNGRFGEPHSVISVGLKFINSPVTDQMLAMLQFLDTREAQWAILTKYVNQPATQVNANSFTAEMNRAAGENPAKVLYKSCERLEIIQGFEPLFKPNILPLEKPLSADPKDTLMAVYLSMPKTLNAINTEPWLMAVRRLLAIA